MSRARSLRWIWLIPVVLLLDQGTKQLAVGLLEPGRPMIILTSTALPSIDLLLSYNRGVSFSFLRFADDAQRWPLVGLSLLACGVLGWWLARVPSRQPILATGLALIIAGALGFGGIAGASAGIAQILFFIFLAFLVISLVAGLMRRAG